MIIVQWYYNYIKEILIAFRLEMKRFDSEKSLYKRAE